MEGRHVDGGPVGARKVEGRAERARPVAHEEARRREILGEAMKLLRERRMIRRCAWCGRYSLGTIWLDESEIPAVVQPVEGVNVTHGICELCFELVQPAPPDVQAANAAVPLPSSSGVAVVPP